MATIYMSAKPTADLNIYARDGSYIIPGGCIDTTPPEIPANNVARWTGNSGSSSKTTAARLRTRKTTARRL